MPRSSVLATAATALIPLWGCSESPTQLRDDFSVPSTVALASLMALGDGPLMRLTGDLTGVADTPEARAGEWEPVRPLLAGLMPGNAPALLWFAGVDGTYWTVQEGLAGGNLTQRDYFQRVLAGETVIGELVMSMATGRGVAVIAVPIQDEAGAVVGAVGASVFLDDLSTRVIQQMDLPNDVIIYSFDERGVVGLNRDPALILADAMQLGPEIAEVFAEMLSQDSGVVSYHWAGRVRTVRYARSSESQLRYAIGLVHD